MELHDALAQISEIRQRMAGGQVFRGYRAATTALTAIVAVVAAVAQAVWMHDPRTKAAAYVSLWVGAAFLCLLGVGVELAVRCRRSQSVLQRQTTLLALDQFIPSVLAGGLLTWAVVDFAADALWMLPGLWAVVFSLGIFASRRFLPRGIALAAGYYLLAGLHCLTLREDSLSPWTMGTVFGAGQLLTAGILYWSLERHHPTRETSHGG